MLGWMLYAVVVALILSAAAFVAESAAQLRKAPTRWLWAASLLASAAVPLVMSSVSIQIIGAHGGAAGPALRTLIPLGQFTPAVVQPSAWLPAPATPLAGIARAGLVSLDSILLCAWAAASLAMLLWISVGGLQLRRRKRAWKLQLAGDAPVYVSDDVGPAVVGLVHPSIVVPRWIAEGEPQAQALVLAHEQSHLAAGDAQLLALAVLMIAAVPWNLPLWWQLRRLRFAIEVDCDSRVLKAGHDVSHYGRTLIAVGERQSRRVAVVAAMSESKSFLEQRIRKMLWKPTRLAWASATALAGLGLVLTAAAAAVTPPPHAAATSSEPQTADAPLRRYRDDQWHFALSVPEGWHAYPPVPSNSPFEVVRFLSNENGVHSLIVFRNPYDPSTDPAQVVAGAQRGLAQGGFGNFVTGQTTIGSRPVLTLDFDKVQPNGRTWSVREYFIVDGTLMYVLGFGTSDRAGMFGLYDRMAKSFTFDASAS